MTKDTFVKLDTLKDIYVANLSVMMPVNTLFFLKSGQANGVYEALIKKTIINPLQINCLKYLMKHKNVTCVMSLAAKMYIQEFEIKYNFRGMKIAKEYFQNTQLELVLTMVLRT